MKKNLISVLILALVVANLVLSAILVFTIIPQTKKSNELITKVCSAIDLELTSGANENQNTVPIEDIEVYNIADSFTINLKEGADGKAHYVILSVGLSMNTKSEAYEKYGANSGEGLKAKESIIKNDINSIIGSFTLDEFNEDTQAVQDAILEDLQEMFGSDFIVGVSFSSVTTQ